MKKIKGVLKKYKDNEIAAWTIQKIDYELNPEVKWVRRFKRGEVLFAYIGKNVGYEQNNPRPVVVIENNNTIRDRCVTIIPLSSIKQGKVHPKYEIDLGRVKGIGNEDRVHTKALPKQIRTIDKIRIDYNKKVMARLSNEQLDAIDEKLKELFIKNK
jgi:mRNA-degrading endonuclease toxin of MazEF toxin-antitoxin module